MVVGVDVAPTANASGKVGRRVVRPRDRTIVAGGRHREDVRGAQRLQVGLEFEVAALPRSPGEVDDVRSVIGGRVAVGIEQPLEGGMDAARAY